MLPGALSSGTAWMFLENLSLSHANPPSTTGSPVNFGIILGSVLGVKVNTWGGSIPLSGAT